jgi:hypothetical protein
MKEYCTGRILFSTLAIGTGLLLANNAMADKGETSGKGSSAASMKRAGRTVTNVFTPARRHRRRSVPEPGP